MAQVIWQQLGQGEWQSDSAGSKPSGYVHPMALSALTEIGMPTEGLSSKSVDLFLDQEIDLAVTVCDNAATDCPLLPGAAKTLHWPFDDPADATGSDDEKMKVFRRVRDEIHQKIKNYLTA
jgi:arsenate reductase